MKHSIQFLCIISVILFLGKVVFAGPTMVSGNVSGTWNVAGSPYYLIDNCTVPSSELLFIEPGVEVNIGENLSLTVNGWIEAIGTKENHISIKSPGSTTFWNKIVINYSGSGVSKFNFCDFSNGTTALHLLNDAYTNSIMINEIKNCTFNNCIDNAIFVQAKGVFKSNYMSAPTAYRPFTSPIIDSCIFSNSTNGIVLYVSGSRWQHTMGYWYTYGGSSPNISNNVFNNISEMSFFMNKGSYIINNSFPVFINNTIQNCQKGILTQSPYDAIIQNNIFYDNLIGVERVTDGLSSDVFFNDFYDNETNFIGYPSSYGFVVMNNANGDPCDISFNIFLDPSFAGDTNVHLTRNSPCINAGSSENAPEIDMDGDSRPQQNEFDIGADEFYLIDLIANAGPDQIVCSEFCDGVVLDGRKSYALNSIIISYDWELTYRGDDGYNQFATGETPTVIGLMTGVYDVLLTVTDDSGFQATDQMTLSIKEECNVCSIIKGDLDSDGDVDGDDLKIFSQNFGTIVLTP